jgi:hypothetical protein
MEEGTRYSIIYEFNTSKACHDVYEKYLTEVVTPKIPVGATVNIKGHTDIIGEEVKSKGLSLARANDAKYRCKCFSKANLRTDVKFDVSGYGENEQLTFRKNNTPEERFYNRTVIDIYSCCKIVKSMKEYNFKHSKKDRNLKVYPFFLYN